MFFVSGSTDVGIKKSINQDSIMLQRIDTSNGEMIFACLCDGMGGLKSGELASATVMYAFRNWLHEKLPCMTSGQISEDVLREQWSEIVETANNNIVAYGRNEEIMLGTTLTVVLFTQTDYYIANIGDSRAYEIDGVCTQLTHDHTFVQQEVDMGRMTPEEALVSNQKHILTKCIGAMPGVEPDFFTGKIKKNAVYMLCSDGFRHKVTEGELVYYFDGNSIDSSEQLKSIEMELIDINKQRIENDNISVISVLMK